MAFIKPKNKGDCPHCGRAIVFEFVTLGMSGEYFEELSPAFITFKPSADYGGPVTRDDGLATDNLRVEYAIAVVHCPACDRLVVSLQLPDSKTRVIWPIGSQRAAPEEVPAPIAQDYLEAAAVLHSSPKASAALSRSCLQAVLREAGKTTQRDLAKQIDEVLPSLPSFIAGAVDHIRNVGNFAAHQTKSHSTGEVVAVEPGEAEWNLDVLKLLFDHYYVQPAKTKQMRNELNEKLKDAGKRPMK